MTKTFKTQIASKFGAFKRNQDGAVGMIFGLSVVPMVMMIALAVDVGRKTHMDQKLSDAVDSATLAAAKLIKQGRATDEEVKDAALAFFKANVPGNYAVYNEADFDVAIDRVNSKIEIKLPVYVETTFARIAGIDKMWIPQKSTAVFALRDIEVGMALDVTGSMKDPVSGGGTKLAALKSAFTKFANLMLPDIPLPGQTVRVGLAPYASAINLGPYAKDASNNLSTDGCVVERSTNVYSDASPSAGGYFAINKPGPTGRRSIDAITSGSLTYECPTAAPVKGLTTDRQALIDSVNSYRTYGATAGHFGAQWAWNLVSPEWGSVWGGTSRPDDYSKVTDKKLVKAVILMTDGEFNTAYANTNSAVQALRLCTAMKDKGIQVFSLTLGLNNAAAKKTMQDCATPGDDYFVDAASEADLDEAFAKFAGKINALRLAQ
jgi:Flp pilus assembly protein TadG